jgi:hypothetical protein
MEIEKELSKTKILVNVYEPLIDIMKRKMDAACLKRDAYLDKALRSEINFLLEGTTSNSDKAKNYIADNLKELKLKPLNLMLSTATIDLMNSVCKEKNVLRDAFINRVFLLMVANETVLNELFSEYRDENYGEYGEYDYGYENTDFRDEFQDLGGGMAYCSPNILDVIESIIEIPPLWRLRAIFSGYRQSQKVNLYDLSFKRYELANLPPEYSLLRVENSIGFNVFMSDDEVSKQELQHSQINTKAATDSLLAVIQQEKLAKIKKYKDEQKEEDKNRNKKNPAPETKATNVEASGESQ